MKLANQGVNETFYAWPSDFEGITAEELDNALIEFRNWKDEQIAIERNH